MQVPRRARQRKRPEIDSGDDAQSAQRANHHFVDVVARHIFHHAAAALRRDTIAGDELHPENEISRRSVKLAQRGIDAGRDCAARSRAIRERDGERKKLAVFGERGRDLVQRNSRLNAQSEVPGIVRNNAVHAVHIKRNVVLPRRHSDSEFRSRTCGNNRELFTRRKFHDFDDFFARTGPHDRGRRLAINLIRCNLRRVARDVCNANDFGHSRQNAGASDVHEVGAAAAGRGRT